MKLPETPHTPSFYSTENEWAEFLALAPNYCILQTELVKALPAGAKNILDLGSATGDTVFRIAAKCKKAKVLATDVRSEVLLAAKQAALRKKVPNVSFQPADMERVGKFLSAKRQQGVSFDVVTMLYSFHHLQDPLANKKRFAKELFKGLPKGATVVVADVCTMEKAGSKKYAESVREQWLGRWGYVFKGVRDSLLKRLQKSGVPNIDARVLAGRAAQKAADLEGESGRFVEKRENEYPITKEELLQIFKAAGFKTAKLTAVNGFGEVVLVAKK
ncbi:MAG: methyltransferase domain-containing protein [Candidatus Micrarchaeia archaeon]|jgi:ubiquinone/menaquinone biosynthesis C-methylase UbiE